MSSTNTDSDRERLLTLLADIDFAQRYYTLCEKFATSGPGLPVDDQRALVEELHRGFAYDKREKFFGLREPVTATGDQLGLHVNLRDGSIELVLVFAAPAGHVGGPFAGLALAVKRRSVPDYKHSPAYPRPKYANRSQARDALVAGVELYDAIRSAILDGGKA